MSRRLSFLCFFVFLIVQSNFILAKKSNSKESDESDEKSVGKKSKQSSNQWYVFLHMFVRDGEFVFIFILYMSSYDDVEEPFIYFATKTAYRFNQNKNDDEIKPTGNSILFHT